MGQPSKPPIPLHLVRGVHVVLDRDLARVYGVGTRDLNKAIKRNPDRFPGDYSFMLGPEESRNLISQSGTSSGHGGRRKPVRVFSEHGAIMAATVLRSPRAVQMSLYVVKAFVRMRQELMSRAEMERRLVTIEKTLIGHDAALRDLYQKIKPLLMAPPEPPRRRIGFSTPES